VNGQGATSCNFLARLPNIPDSRKEDRRMNRHHLLVATAAFRLGIRRGTIAHAGTFAPFTPEAFQKVQASNTPLLIEVYAPWCLICVRQQPIMKELETSSKYSGVTVLRADQVEGQAKVHGISRGKVIRKVFLAEQPTKRFATIEETAGTAVFLCGAAAASVIGAGLSVDGGWTTH
jgi:hypothetical protein